MFLAKFFPSLPIIWKLLWLLWFQDSTNSMRNLHQILLEEDGIEAWHLFRLWEKPQLRASEYKNHRIFTLRCLHNDLIPVSIKLKLTLKSARANKILRKAEKELLQTGLNQSTTS